VTLRDHLQEVHDFIKEHELPVVSVHATNGRDKIETLLDLESQIHFDDFD